MIITVNHYKDNLVYFSTIYGEASAAWEGDAPKLNHQYMIEFDVDESFQLGENLFKSSSNKHEIRQHNDWTFFVGILESIEPDGYAILRFGTSLISILIDHDFLDVGAFIEIKTNKLSLFPYDEVSN